MPLQTSFSGKVGKKCRDLARHIGFWQRCMATSSGKVPPT